MAKNAQVQVETVAPTTEVDVKVKETIQEQHVAEADKLSTKSAKIRFLDSAGYKRGTIATHLGIRYQHVRNVLTQPLKKA
jgi:hypothetical protein